MVGMGRDGVNNCVWRLGIVYEHMYMHNDWENVFVTRSVTLGIGLHVLCLLFLSLCIESSAIYITPSCMS